MNDKSSGSGPAPSRRHHPRGLPLLHEDAEVIVVDKPNGLLSMGTERDKTRTAHSILNDYVRRGNPKSRNRVYIVHRLDRETSGVMLFAKSEAAKVFLQDDWDNTNKRYLAVVTGHLAQPAGRISSYLTENAAFHVYSTQDPAQGRLSQTDYTLIKEQRGLSLVRIDLLTGRKHQIRVHFSEKGHPILGDDKYGRAGGPTSANLALHAYALDFTHPVSGLRLHFQTAIPALFTRLMGAFAV